MELGITGNEEKRKFTTCACGFWRNSLTLVLVLLLVAYFFGRAIYLTGSLSSEHNVTD